MHTIDSRYFCKNQAKINTDMIASALFLGSYNDNQDYFVQLTVLVWDLHFTLTLYTYTYKFTLRTTHMTVAEMKQMLFRN